MATIYSNKIRDPHGKEIPPDVKYLICRKIEERWHLLEGKPTLPEAMKFRQILAAFGRISPDRHVIPDYMVFNRDECHIREYL